MKMNIKELLGQATEKLQSTSDSARLDCEILLSFVLKQTRSWLYTWPDYVISDKQYSDFQQLLSRRLKGEPVAHIVGEQEFWSLTLKVTPDTLIPRADTECLVEQALIIIPQQAFWNIADLGTGSGAIALALASERPSCNIIASDKSIEALSVAEENAHLHHLNNIRFVRSIWFEDLHNHVFDMIVSNPPYIAENDPHLVQGDVRFEPGSALTSGPEGLDDLAYLINNAPGYLKPGGWLLLEHGYDQASVVLSLLEHAGFTNCQNIKDYGGNPRVSLGQYPH